MPDLQGNHTAITSSVASGQSREGSSLSNVLRHCVGSGLLLLDTDRKTAIFTKQAEQILGFAPGTNPAFEALPAPLLQLASEVVAESKSACAQPIEITRGVAPLRR